MDFLCFVAALIVTIVQYLFYIITGIIVFFIEVFKPDTSNKLEKSKKTKNKLKKGNRTRGEKVVIILIILTMIMMIVSVIWFRIKYTY